MSEGPHLIDAYVDGELTSGEEVRLAEWLAADAEHVRQFVRETYIHRQIRELMLARPYRAYGLAEGDDAARQPKAAPVRWLGCQLGRLLGIRYSPALGGSLAALAACLLLVAGGGFWYFGPTMGEPVLAEFEGTGLSLERAGQSIPARAGTRLLPGDVVRTPDHASATIAFTPEKTRITVQPGTELKLMAWSRGKRLALGTGQLAASVSRQRPFQPMVIVTSQAEARVLGTRFTLTATTNSTRLDVAEGKVQFTRLSDGAAVKVPADHYAVVANATELAALPQTGGILREWWTNVSDQTMHDLRGRGHVSFPGDPATWDVAHAIVLESVNTNRLGIRFRGYLHPPVTGDYTIWLTGPTDTAFGETVLLVSSSEDAADATPIARTGSPPYTPSPPPFRLVAGRRYYLEALIFIEKGEGHLSLEWKRPAGSRELLTSEFLSPFKPE